MLARKINSCRLILPVSNDTAGKQQNIIDYTRQSMQHLLRHMARLVRGQSVYVLMYTHTAVICTHNAPWPVSTVIEIL